MAALRSTTTPRHTTTVLRPFFQDHPGRELLDFMVQGEINNYFIFALWFLSSFFLRLISAVAEWMSTILLHMVWP